MKSRLKTTPLRQFARDQLCTVQSRYCNGNPETTCLAHLPGAGTAIKTHDLLGVHACSRCHDYIDRRLAMITEQEFWALIGPALLLTLERVEDAGLMPSYSACGNQRTTR